MAVELDEIDVRLLTALQEDADCTNVELARLVGLSPAATLHRVRWLKESGVIRVISAQLDPAAAGFPLQVYVTAALRGVLAGLPTGGGQRLVPSPRRAEINPPSRLPLVPPAPPADGPPRRRRRAAARPRPRA